ncbi:MAG TPA: glycosyltransferase family 2 protein [Vicinamibacterales bacterium]|nr:glycosyltransferase family 2 protein [Vicinamibacterales bacterium]
MADAATVSIVVPAMNEEHSIGDLVTELRAAAPWREVLVVDDGSSDATAMRAETAGARVIRHPYNKGNGAAVKTGIRAAAGEFILIIDADGQHPPADALRLAAQLGVYDLVVGARTAQTQATAARRRGNAMLNGLASYLTGRTIPDLTSGFRGARTACLREFIHLLPNGFSTPTTTTLAFIKAGYNVTFVAIAARSRLGQSKIRFARDGARFTLILFKIITLFSPLRIFLPISGASFTVGAFYGIWNVVAHGRIPNGSVVLVLFAVIVFLFGLISEQIAALRFEGPRA